MTKSKATILVVDDQADVRLLCKMVLEAGGYVTILAENASDGLRAYNEHPEIAVVLADAVMPIKSGTEMAYEIFAANPFANIIMMTGYNPDTVIPHPLRNLCTTLIKPFDLTHLLATVDECVEFHAAGNCGVSPHEVGDG